MRKTLFILCIAVGMTISAGADDSVFGDGVTLDAPVSIDTLLASPDDWVGETVRVDGVITGVCKKRGCWMQISDPDSGNGVRIKVEDGVMVFPYTSMGHRASAQGVFEGFPVAAEAHQDHAEHGAKQAAHEGASKTACNDAKKAATETRKCAGETNENPAGCGAKKQGKMVYLVKGTGAVIQG